MDGVQSNNSFTRANLINLLRNRASHSVHTVKSIVAGVHVVDASVARRRNEGGAVLEVYLDLTIDASLPSLLILQMGQLDSALYRLVEKYREISRTFAKSDKARRQRSGSLVGSIFNSLGAMASRSSGNGLPSPPPVDLLAHLPAPGSPAAAAFAAPVSNGAPSPATPVQQQVLTWWREHLTALLRNFLTLLELKSYESRWCSPPLAILPGMGQKIRVPIPAAALPVLAECVSIDDLLLPLCIIALAAPVPASSPAPTTDNEPPVARAPSVPLTAPNPVKVFDGEHVAVLPSVVGKSLEDEAKVNVSANTATMEYVDDPDTPPFSCEITGLHVSLTAKVAKALVLNAPAQVLKMISSSRIERQVCTFFWGGECF